MAEFDWWRAVPALVAFFGGLVALPGVIKIWNEIKHFRRGIRRAEAEFALKLNEKIPNPLLTRYAKELGFAALVGDNHLRHEQRVAMLSLDDAELIIAKYSNVRHWVDVRTHSPYFFWKRPRHASAFGRRAILALSYGGYALFGTIGLFLPEVFKFIFTKPSAMPPLEFAAFLLVFLGALAIFCLGYGIKLGLAAELINTQPQQPGSDTRGDVDEHD
jgi:hypothetical protein